MRGTPEHAVAYVVSTWPRLSQTFVLNEILAVERAGLRVRIFSAKDPGGEPIHGDVFRVRAAVTYLSLRKHWRAIFAGNLHMAAACPMKYASSLASALHDRGVGVVPRFLQAVYLARILRLEPVSHLHAHFATVPALVSMYASRLTGIPYSFTAHAKDIYVDANPDVLRAQIRSAKAVVTISQYNLQHLRTLAPSLNGKLRCIYNGLDLVEFSVRREAPVAAAPLVLAVGRLIEKKGFADLIAAAAILRDRKQRFEVEIIGAGPLRRALEDQVRTLGVETHVHLSGAQSQELVKAAYRRAVIFALPCIITAEGDRDGIPTVLIEAMACGIPVVSTPISGIPELIDHERDGLLVAPRNAGQLADALARLLTDVPLRERLALAARKKIERRFDIEKGARKLMELFAETARL